MYPINELWTVLSDDTHAYYYFCKLCSWFHLSLADPGRIYLYSPAFVATRRMGCERLPSKCDAGSWGYIIHILVIRMMIPTTPLTNPVTPIPPTPTMGTINTLSPLRFPSALQYNIARNKKLFRRSWLTDPFPLLTIGIVPLVAAPLAQGM